MKVLNLSSWFLALYRESYGDMSDEDTPGPIPNPAVKLVSADGSVWATARKSRSLPKDSFLFMGDASKGRRRELQNSLNRLEI